MTNPLIEARQLGIFNSRHVLDTCHDCKYPAMMTVEDSVYRVECSKCSYTMTADRSAGPLTAMVEWNRLQRRLREGVEG
jgi:Zn ribbon nucleic-acid-binding protein